MSKREPGSAPDNVVSLESRRAGRSRPPAEEPAAEAQADAGEAAAAPPQEPIPGTLTWLHCPTCGTLEYTELVVPGGRRHKCGTVVEEASVQVDIRAEQTLAGLNLERIRTLSEYLEAQRRHFEEYRRRLEIMAGEAPAPYPATEELIKSLPVEEIDPLGLLISRALAKPARRFADRDRS